MKEKEEEGGGWGRREGRKAREGAAFKEDAPSKAQRIDGFALTRLQPLEDARPEAQGPGLSGSQFMGWAPTGPAATPKAEKASSPLAGGGVGMSSA